MSRTLHSRHQRAAIAAVLIAGCTVGLLGGCAVGPDFVPPNPDVPDSYSGVPVDHTESPADLAKWWTVLNDPVLESLITRALAANPDIDAATARVRQARASSKIAFGALLPTLDINGSGRRSGAGQHGTSIVTTDSPTVAESSGGGGPRNLFQIGLDASWELDVFGGTRRSIEAANATEAASVESLRDVQVTLAAEVATQYVQLRSAQERLLILQNNKELADSNVDIVSKRSVAGFDPPFDLASARAQAASTAAQIPDAESAIRQQIFALDILLGLPPETAQEDLLRTSSLPADPPPIPGDAPSNLARRRPDIREAEANLHAATAEVGVATADLFPKISLSAFLGTEGSSVSALDSWKNHLWNSGGSLAGPIFHGGALEAELERQKAALDEVEATYRSTVLQALGEVETAALTYRAARLKRGALSTAFEESRKALDASTQLYTAGIGEYVAVLTAQQSSLQAEQQLLQAKTDSYTALVALYKALGGGWSD